MTNPKPTDTSFDVTTTYSYTSRDTVELPEGKTFADLAEYYVKWETFHYRLKGEDEWREDSIETDPMSVIEGIDWKRPDGVVIEAADENEEDTACPF